MSTAQNWSRENLAWCAALFEGEGSISLRRRDKAVILKLGMTDEDVVRRFHLLVGIGKVGNPVYSKTHEHYKPHWDWWATGSEKVQAILAAFWPWLGARRQARAREAILRIATVQRYGGRTRHCKRGHEYTVENTRYVGRERVCKSCAKENTAHWREKNNKRLINGPGDVCRSPDGDHKLDEARRH